MANMFKYKIQFQIKSHKNFILLNKYYKGSSFLINLNF